MSSLVFSSVGLNDQYHRVVSLPPAAVLLHADQKKITVKDDDGDDDKEEKEEVGEVVPRKGNGFRLAAAAEEEEAGESSESSSIGVASSSSSKDCGDQGEEEEVQSKSREEGAFRSLDSLEESLPIKRGLSNFFSGKSKSFASLSDVANATINDLKKPENPFNKRRRILMACKARRASYSSLIPLASTSLPPLLLPDHTVEEGEEYADDKGVGGGGGGVSASLAPTLARHGNNEKKVMRSFRSPRSFSLSDLQHA